MRKSKVKGKCSDATLRVATHQQRLQQHRSMKRGVLSTAVRRGLGIGGAAMMLSLSPVVQSQSTFGAVFELSDLDGSDGFVLNGVDGGDFSGRSVSSAGDVNGDGVDDLLIGNFLGDPNNNFSAGESYVVFGGSGVGSTGVLELSELDGTNGFVLNGIDAADFSGISVAGAGDINEDGVDDLLIGANAADPNGKDNAGESYVVFGGSGVGSTGVLELSELDGTDGFVLNGVDAGDRSGGSLGSAGDFNGDGVVDLLLSSYQADRNDNNNSTLSNEGESYVVFGGSGVGSTGVFELSELDGANGFVLNGVDSPDSSGRSVSSAGDINGDNVDDLVIGAEEADPNGLSNAGESYVVFGGADVGISGVLELSELDGADGFVLNGIDAGDRSGGVVSKAGDVNGDGVGDLLIGADLAEMAGSVVNFNEGESYVIFGGNGVGNSGVLELSDLDGTDGFVLSGIDQSDRAGNSVSGAGDINGDGVDDLLIGAALAEMAGSASNINQGESYVVFGGSAVGNTGLLELSELDGTDGFVLNGIDRLDESGESVSSAGDINGDGVDDLIIGAPRADPSGKIDAGEIYVVFGKNVPQCNGLFVTVDLNFGETPGPGPDVVLGTSGNDDIRGRAGDDTICGEGGNDFIHGNSGNDWIDGGSGVDDLRGGQGDDVINTGRGATVGTSSIVFGGNGDDEINGGSDADDLRGGQGVDVIDGMGGNDVITGNADGDFIYGGDGDDELRGGQGDDQLFGDAGDDFLSGGGGLEDLCDGGDGVDTATSSCEMVSEVP